MATRTDVGTRAWGADGVTRLRVWGSERVYAVPERGAVMIGAAASCAIRIVDDRVSQRHAELARERRRLVVRDAGSTNGVLLDGARRTVIVVEPGDEIGIGGATLVAEGPRWIALRAFVARMLGWSRGEAVDLAMRAVKMAAARSAALVLSGDGDLVAIARALHARTLGDARAFVLCDPRRRAATATVRTAANHALGMPALAAAAGGTLCVWSRRLPPDYERVAAALRDPGRRVQLIACTHELGEAERFAAAAIAVPPLAARAGELVRVIDAYAEDASIAIGAELTAVDRAWVRAHSAASLPDIEKGTLRLAAVRRGGSITRAAQLLGMSHVALTEWIGRRRLPVNDQQGR